MNLPFPYPPVGKVYRREDIELVAQKFRDAYPGFRPSVGLCLGTGFAAFSEQLQDTVTIPYNGLPYFTSELQTPGHVGEFVMGRLEGQDIICTRGKMFLLDGVPAQVAVLTVRLFYLLGCRTLIYTNASGGINPAYQTGDFVFLHNHINLMGQNPLMGERNGEWGPLFFDMTYPYDAELRELGQGVAAQVGLRVQEGVYAGLHGPSFETAAEIKMLARVGADLVGMSTVMEVIAARQLGMRVLAIGFVSNMAAGVTAAPVENDDVQKAAGEVQATFARLMQGIVTAVTAAGPR